MEITLRDVQVGDLVQITPAGSPPVLALCSACLINVGGAATSWLIADTWYSDPGMPVAFLHGRTRPPH
jgi:hypothetical protein